MSEANNLFPQPDSESAIRFLQMFEPEGPWVLTAEPPYMNENQELTDIPSYLNEHLTRTFHPHEANLLKEWLDRWNGRINLCFQVNRAVTDSNGKARRREIDQVRWLYANVFLRGGEPVEEEQQRIRGLLAERRPTEVPAPTAIIFSGRGFQVLWRLNEPIVVDGSLTAYRASRYNLALEWALQGDNCNNIDWSARLPGTINIPNDLRRRERRPAALVRLISFDDSRRYQLSAFTPAPPPPRQWASSGSRGGRNV